MFVQFCVQNFVNFLSKTLSFFLSIFLMEGGVPPGAPPPPQYRGYPPGAPPPQLGGGYPRGRPPPVGGGTPGGRPPPVGGGYPRGAPPPVGGGVPPGAPPPVGGGYPRGRPPPPSWGGVPQGAPPPVGGGGTPGGRPPPVGGVPPGAPPQLGEYPPGAPPPPQLGGGGPPCGQTNWKHYLPVILRMRAVINNGYILFFIHQCFRSCLHTRSPMQVYEKFWIKVRLGGPTQLTRWLKNSRNEQDSPPAWPQEAYLPPAPPPPASGLTSRLTSSALPGWLPVSKKSPQRNKLFLKFFPKHLD